MINVLQMLLFVWFSFSSVETRMVCKRGWSRNDDRDGIREVYVNTIEGFCTGLRSFLPKTCINYFQEEFYAFNINELQKCCA